MAEGETNHGQTALTEAITKSIDRTIAEWNITPVEIVGVLHTLATAVTVRVLDGTFGKDPDGEAPDA